VRVRKGPWVRLFGLVVGITTVAGCTPKVLPPSFYVQLALPYGPSVFLDAYVPFNPGHGTVLLLHPGGFVGGRREGMAPLAQALAEEGFTTLTIDYSLPAHFEQATAELSDAVDFARSRYGSNDIALFGASAGGTIALDGATGVRAVVAWSPVLDLARAGLLQGAADVYVEGSSPERASPLSVIHAGYPPTLIATSRRDLIPLTQSEAVAVRLGDLRIPHELLVYPAGHALQLEREALEPTIQFLHRYLGS
jgi:acetyl esterase/lipase